MRKYDPQPGEGFMRVKIREVGKALHPSERMVEVKTISGTERLVVDKRAIENNSLSVGSPISRHSDAWLIELPRETTSGYWRVWVDAAALLQDVEARVA
jgi:hypothetical protein